MATVNGSTLLSATVTMPRVGAWTCDLEADEEVTLAGTVSVEIDGVEFVGSVVRSRPFAGRTQARLAGGGGTLSRDLDAKNYSSGPKVRSIVLDILGAGEVLAATSDAGVLDAVLPGYQRVQGIAQHALVTLLDVINATWRVLADGTVWVGRDTYPEANPPHVLQHEDWYTGILTIAPEAPTLLPGVTFRGHKIEEVVHYLTPGGTRSDAHLTSLSSSLEKFLGQIRRAIDYSKRWPARVAGVNLDGTIQVVPDDARMKGAGLDRVRVRSGVPGSIKPALGSRCLVGFDAGDPSRPYAEGWDGADVQEMALADGYSPAARVGSTVNVFFPPIVSLSGTVNGLPFVGQAIFPLPAIGLIQDGNPKVKV